MSDGYIIKGISIKTVCHVGQQYMLPLNNQITQIEIKWNSFPRVNERFLFVNFRLWSPNLPNSTKNLLVIYYYLDKWRTERYSMEHWHSLPVKEALLKPEHQLPWTKLLFRLCPGWGSNGQSVLWPGAGVINSRTLTFLSPLLLGPDKSHFSV